jgi:predicted nucleic acid-binding protein
MTVSAFFDTNVLVYAFANQARFQSDPRALKAEHVMSLGGVVSVQVLNEFTDVADHKWKMPWKSIEEAVHWIGLLCGRPAPLTEETHTAALELSKRYGFRIYDSLILASAIDAGCAVLYTEDLQHGQVIDGLRIENPFLGL